jgi:hypothetical protein
MEESAHPYENNQDYRKAFHINGASRLVVRFDPRCHINTDMLSRVAFYRCASPHSDALFVMEQTFERVKLTYYTRSLCGSGHAYVAYPPHRILSRRCLLFSGMTSIKTR